MKDKCNQEEEESDDLLKKLIDNIRDNPALQNEYIRSQFNLGNIKGEEDLHEYKNLLNSMAALFYTNHRLNDVTLLFYMWREAAAEKLKQKKQAQKKVPPIQIDTELANQDVFDKYDKHNQDILDKELLYDQEQR